jgi:metallothionein
MAGTKKCAHPACSCIAPDKQKYCSQICQDSKNVTALACHCDHSACRGEALKP